MINFESITKSHERIREKIHATPIMTSTLLNQMLGHRIYFKAENFQLTGSFKIRGAMNAIAKLHEQGQLKERVVTYSSGNHGQALAKASSAFNLKTTVYMPEYTSAVKQLSTRSYGAQVVLCKNRQEAERRVAQESEHDTVLIPPFDHDDVIAGQGTIILDDPTVLDCCDAIFAPIGGGGFISGISVSAKALNKKIKIIGAEPVCANDAKRSVQSGKIFRWNDSPDTIADGVKTLSISERTFDYLKTIDQIYEITENEIMYWTQWICHLLKIQCEPTSALSMAAALKWLRSEKKPRSILVMLTGGNIAPDTFQKVWRENYLTLSPGTISIEHSI